MPTASPLPRRAPRLLLAAVAGLALVLSGCAAGSGDAGTGSPEKAGATLTHAFGDTTVPASPKRVVTLGWGSTEAALALGVVPVAMPFQSYGGDSKGVLPWIADKLKQLKAKTPTVLSDSPDAPPYDEIAAAKPDVILAPYSGITKKQYTTLSEIAPTVAYPKAAWTTPWRDTIQIVGDALGKGAQAKKYIAGLDAKLAGVRKAHPEFAGKTVALVWDVAGTFYVYRPEDSRADFITDFGFTPAKSVDELVSNDPAASTFTYKLSYELVDKLTSDVLVTFGDTRADVEKFEQSSYGQSMQQVKDGAVAAIVGTPLIASVSPPTALSLDYGLDDYVSALSAAVAKAP